MLRWTMPLIAALVAVGTSASAADGTLVVKRGAYRAASQLPPGLPRAHYRYRTTVAPPGVGPKLNSTAPRLCKLLFTPSSGYVPYFPPVVGAPLLPGSSTLPGYYGRAFDYDYQGPYYGGPYVPYWDRLPYACGVYGYC